MKINDFSKTMLPGLNDMDALTSILETLDRTTPEESKRKAAEILDRFGNLKTVLEADAVTLKTATTPATAERLAALLPIFRTYENRSAGTQIANRCELETYCKSLLCGLPVENFVLIAVNAQCKLIGYRTISTGSLSEVSAYPRLVIKSALDMNAHSVFFAHNHPGGTCAPSAEDIETTLKLQRSLSDIGIHVLDHLIVAGSETYSMAVHGDIQYK